MSSSLLTTALFAIAQIELYIIDGHVYLSVYRSMDL